jgi:hypothetical protein
MAEHGINGPQTLAKRGENTMAELTKGTVTVKYDDGIKVPPEAGTLSITDIRRLEKTRRGVGVASLATAEAIRKRPDLAPKGVTADELEDQGRQADAIDFVIVDLEGILHQLKQANLMIDAKANEMLRKVLANVRSQEKFDASVTKDVPHLISYFQTSAPSKNKTEA